MPAETLSEKCVSIRRLRTGDASALAAFYNGLSASSKRTFAPLGPSTTRAVCARVIRDNAPERGKKFDLVAVEGNAIAGWSFLWDVDSEKPTFGLSVADAYHGKGLGTRLMDEVLTEARRVGKKRVLLTVVVDNEKAWRMYERRGFKRCGEHVNSVGIPHYEMVAEIE